MNDEEFLSIGEDSDWQPIESTRSPLDSQAGSPKQPWKDIMEIRMYTINTFKIYPNGQMFITKSQSWFDKPQKAKQKKEKKIAEPQKAELNNQEEY